MNKTIKILDKFHLKNLVVVEGYNEYTREYIYKDKYIRSLEIGVEPDRNILNNFFMNDDKKMTHKKPKNYVGKKFQQLLKHLVDIGKLEEWEYIDLNSDFFENFEERDPKNLLKYYESLGFKLKGEYKMKHGDDQFHMVGQIFDLLHPSNLL